MQGDSRVGADDAAPGLVGLGDLGAGGFLVDRDGRDLGAQGRKQGRRQGHRTLAGEGLEHRARGLGVAARGLEHQPLEVRRRLDIHGDRGRLDRCPARIKAVVDGAGQGVVLVHRRDEARDRQAHLARGDAGEGVAEIACRHDEDGRAGFTLGRQLGDGGDIVGNLAGQPRPVDRVDRTEPPAITQALVGQQALHQPLAVVEVAVDRQIQDVVGLDGGHLATLHGRDPVERVQDHQVDAGLVGEGVDGGGARVAAGRRDQGQALARGFQRLARQRRGQLHGQVLEGGGRAVEQFQQPQVVLQLHQGRDGRLIETGDQLFQRTVERPSRQGLAEIGRHGSLGDLFIGLAGRPGRGAQRRPGRGHVEAAVGGDAAQQGVGEIGRGGVAARGDIG